MSVSQETLDMITAAIKNGDNVQGSLVRSKLTNRLVWSSPEVDENDPYGQYLRMIGQGRQLMAPPKTTGAGSSSSTGGRMILGENQQQQQHVMHENVNGARRNGKKHDKENWRDQWEILKKPGNYCSLCKNNKEGREIYLSHNLKGPNGEVTCPILKECDCPCCGQRGHTM